MKNKIYLYGYFGFQNTGDDLLFHVVVEHIKNRIKDAHFVVRSMGRVEEYANDKSIQFLCFEHILADMSGTRLQRFIKYMFVNWRVLKGCSHMIFSGGTLFHAREGRLSNLLLMMMLSILAKFRGVRIFAIGVGVDRLDPIFAKLMMSAIIWLSEDFVVRDSSSMLNGQCLLSKNKIRSAADLVFSLDRVHTVSKRHPVGKTIALTIAASDILEQIGRYPTLALEIRKTIVSLQERGWSITFISFQELKIYNNEISDSKFLKKLIGDLQNIKIINASSRLSVLCTQLEEFSLVIGMRFHSLVVSAMSGVRFIGFGRDHKLVDLCHAFSMPFIPIDEFSSNCILDQVYKDSLNEPSVLVLQHMQLESQKNFIGLDRSF